MKVLGISILFFINVVIFGSLNPVFAEEGYFEYDYGQQVSHSPTVCIFQPNDPRISEQRWNNWYSDMTVALSTWETVLEQSGTGYWRINPVEIPLDKLSLLNYSACDITVKFVEKPYIKDGKPANALGWWSGSGRISIVYSAFTYCGTEYLPEFKITVNTYCFGNNIERSKLMASVLQHEFGHAIGLGHYVAFDPSQTQHWYDANGRGAPSIMTPQNPNDELEKVTPVDVAYVRKIYGSQGFGEKTETVQLFRELYIPEPVIEVSRQDSIRLTEGTSQTKLISGYVPDKLYKRGVYLNMIIQSPNGATDTKAVSVSKTLHSFKYPLVFDYTSPSGKYLITLRFDGEVFEKRTVNITKDQSVSKSTKTSHTNPLIPTLYVIDSDGLKTRSTTFKPNEEFLVEGYVYKNNIPQQFTSYKISDNLGTSVNSQTNSNGFFKHAVIAKHTTHQNFGTGNDKSSTMILSVCVSTNCSDVTVYIRGNDGSDNTIQHDNDIKSSSNKENWKQKALLEKSNTYDKISSIQSGIVTATKSLSGIGYDDPDAQALIDKAWEEHYFAKQTMYELVTVQEKAVFYYDNEGYHTAYTHFKKIQNESDSIKDRLELISKLIDDAKKMSDTSHSCFWFWC